MAKLKLNPDPTFKARVEIQSAGEAVDPVEFIFKHRTRDEMTSFVESAINLKDSELIMAVASGWELSDPFTSENINKLVQNYITSPGTIYTKYIEELTKAREKN